MQVAAINIAERPPNPGHPSPVSTTLLAGSIDTANANSKLLV